jgi:hypothetical protein
MKEPLQQIDPDYYRAVQLLIVQVELKQLRQWRVSAERRGSRRLVNCVIPSSESHAIVRDLAK